MDEVKPARHLARLFRFVGVAGAALGATLCPPLLHATPLNVDSAPVSGVVAELGDASISHDLRSGTWSIAAGGATLVLGLDQTRDFQVLLVSSSNSRWTDGASSDSSITVNGSTLRYGSRQDGFSFQDAAATTGDRSLSLTATFDHQASGLRFTRHYTVTSGSPTFETWTTYTPLRGARATLSNLNAFQFTVPAGTVHWLTGLQGDAANVQRDGAFTLQQKTIAPGEPLVLRAQGRSSEQTVPWFAIDGASDEFYAALMWSGAWALTVERTGAGLSLSMGLQSTATTLPSGSAASGSIDGPHAVFGVVPGRLPQASGAIGSYVVQGLRSGRPFMPLVTYNTWFAYGTSITESSMRAEMAAVAPLGVELFVVDAGWYAGTGIAGSFDFDDGLGSWQPDPTRFPNGLHPLTDYAHSLNMKFGIWVEPERVHRSVLGRGGSGGDGPAEEWLATSGGQYGSDYAGQICFANAAARQWVLDRLTALIDDTQPDYLKWDSNMWVNCDRPGHGHGTADGNFAHVTALYGVLAALRDRYPDLLIENVSGGGNRLDLGMLRYTDVAWMDDRTAPSVHVRHNVEGLSALFPPAYLLSFVTDHRGEPLHDAPDLRLYLRSRMVGALGLCFLSAGLSDTDAQDIAREVANYKSLRGTLSLAAGSLLSPQASPDNGPAWDVLQEESADGRHLLVSAFQSDAGTGRITVKPVGLSRDVTYEVRSIDAGVIVTELGSELMATGIDVVGSPDSAAHILIVTAKQ